MLADFGRPRNAPIGTMDFNCFGASGCASGSALADAVMTLSSRADGMATDARLDTFDTVRFRLRNFQQCTGISLRDQAQRARGARRCASALFPLLKSTYRDTE